MKPFTGIALFLSTLSLSTHIHAIPHPKIDDTTILNFALTLEHLENTFYHTALSQFDQPAFDAAGLPPFARGRFQQIADHEKAHVDFLSGALGDNAVKPCTYKFPFTDPKSFAALSQILEGVGVSAYTGAAQFISNKAYLTAAASVLTTEARHASWVASAINKVAGWSGPFDVPLGFNQVYTLAASFIDTCPPSNPSLPFKPFPTLTVTPSTPAPSPGSTIHLSFPPSPHSEHQLYAVFLSGLNQIFVPIHDGKVEVPGEVRGMVYVLVCKSGKVVSDETVVAGPAVLVFEFDSRGDV